MESFDFGVNLSLFLSVGGLILCVAYGIYHWNKGGAEAPAAEAADTWQAEEEKINEEL
jgi:hypothetical protein